MNIKTLIQFKSRYKKAEHFEQSKFIQMSIKEKLQKTISVIQLGFGLGYSIDRSTLDDIQEVRSRWAKLKKVLK